jgi:hypothetical protein
MMMLHRSMKTSEIARRIITGKSQAGYDCDSLRCLALAASTNHKKSEQ